uniref:Ig-like domain-containing protein n=1 Tax=Latimeria chalumnae TaxID=7897 RepID=H3AV69_LATCH
CSYFHRFVYFFLLLAGLCVGDRTVTIQQGLLYRTEGSHITIWCNVTGYQGSSEQNFEWSVYLSESPDREVKIISTSNPHYAYAVYDARVHNKEIYIERVSGDSVLLHITNLQLRDQGEYECYTPNTDPTYLGTYSAKMNLSVLPDTLSATMAPQTLNEVEGDSFMLNCEVSKSTSQHTHLSVAWSLQKGDQHVQIISLSRNFVLHPGSSYAQRYASGNIRLDKIGDTTYRLTIYKLQPSDQGDIYCEGNEWIQDPDKSWYIISEKQTEKTKVNIKTLGKHPDYTVLKYLLIKCHKEPDLLIQYFTNMSSVLKVLYLKQGMLSRKKKKKLGVVTLGDKLKSSKVFYFPPISRLYFLIVSGKLVWALISIYSHKKSEQCPISSSLFLFHFVAKDLKVAVVSNSTTILEGASLQFFCGVTGAQGWLSASWQFITNQKQHNNIIEMDKDGTLKLGPSYRERSSLGDIRMDRVNPYTFMLQIRNALTSDSGQYECKVTDWSMESSTNWKYIAEKLEKVSATVNPMGPGLSVSLLSRKGNLKYNESTKIKCDFSIKADGASGPVPASVTWKFKSSSSSSSSPFQEIVQITHNGNVIWGTQENFKGKTVLEKTASFATLNVKRASEKEGGKYQCSVDLWKKNSLDEWIKGATELSNTVELTVTKPECKLEVNNGEKSINRKGVTDLEITCEIKSQTDPNALFAVTWFVRKTQGLTTEENQKILRMDYNNVVEFGEQLKAEGLKFKFRSERVSSHLYKLSIQQADISDSGKYHCRVEEWLMNPYNTWYQMGVKDSGATVVLIEPSEVGFQVNKTNLSLLVTENKEFQVNCNIEKDVQPDSIINSFYCNNSGSEFLKVIKHYFLLQPGVTCPCLIMHTLHCYPKTHSGTFTLTLDLRCGALGPGHYWRELSQKALHVVMERWVRDISAERTTMVINLLQLESSLYTRVCSSQSLFNFILVFPSLIGIILLAAGIYLYVRFKKVSGRVTVKKENNLWMSTDKTMDQLHCSERENED